MKSNLVRLIVCVLLVLTLAIAPITTAFAASTMKLMKINVDGARLRKGPGNYEIITSLRRGEKVLYSGEMTKSFCLVCTEDGQVGYVFRDYLSNYGVIRADQVYYANTGSVRMYSRANTGSSRVETLSRHELVIVFRTAGNWAYARTLDGEAGYIQLSKLSSF